MSVRLEPPLENCHTREQVALLEERVADLEARLAREVEQTKHYILILELSGQVAWTANPDGSIAAFDQGWLDRTGLTNEEAVAAGWTQLLHPDDLTPTLETWTRALVSGEAYEIEHRIRVASGGYRWVRSRALPRRDANGRISMWSGVSQDIHERKQAETSLHGLGEQLSTIIDSSPLPILTTAKDGNVTLWNPAAERLFGWKADEVLGRPLPFIPEDKREEHRAMRERDLRGERLNGAEVRRMRKDGSLIDIAVSTAPLHDSSGAVTGIMSLYVNITEQKRAERENAQARERIELQWRTFDTALSHTPDSTYIFDLEGRIVYANRALLTLWNKPLEAALGKTLGELDYPPELAERVQRQIRTIVETGQPIRDITAHGGFTPNTRHYEYIFVPVFGAHGNVEAVAGSTRDVTAREEVRAALEQANAELERARQRLISIFESMGDAFFALDHNWCFTYVNNRMEALVSRSRDELLGRNIWDEFAPAVGSVFYHQYHRAMAERVAVEFEDYYAPLDAWLEVRAHPSAEGLGVYLHNINSRKAAQEALRRKSEDLARTNADLEQFAYSASHDLQEPLRMVAIYSQLVQKKYGPQLDAQATEYLGYAVQGARRMESLIKDLLAYTRAGERTQNPISAANAAQVLEQATANLSTAIRESQATIDCDPLPVLPVDEVHLLQLFQNLIGNAIKYRGEVRPAIHVSAQAAGQMWQFRVRDNGIGIAPEYAQLVFGIFKRLHGGDKYEGTGIGLAICQRIVERYGGRVWVESGGNGKGSAFFFTLPAAGINRD